MFEHELTTETIIPASRDAVFEFFSDAANLARLTPSSLHFRIRTPSPIAMREGTVIDYTIRLRGVPMRWKTVIRRWNPPYEFIDEQSRGPYRTWIHRHRFEVIDRETTRMKDHVRFAIRFAPFGELALPWIRGEVRRIFDFRTAAIREIFQSDSDTESDKSET